MSDLKVGEHDLFSWVQPDTLLGAIVYLVIFAAVATLLSRGLRGAVHAAMTRQGHVDRTTISFLPISFPFSGRWARHCLRGRAWRRWSSDLRLRVLWAIW